MEGWKAVHYALGRDAALLDDLIAGRVPQAWTPLETTTAEEVVFLAPLDPVNARGRAGCKGDARAAAALVYHRVIAPVHPSCWQ